MATLTEMLEKIRIVIELDRHSDSAVADCLHQMHLALLQAVYFPWLPGKKYLQLRRLIVESTAIES